MQNSVVWLDQEIRIKQEKSGWEAGKSIIYSSHRRNFDVNERRLLAKKLASIQKNLKNIENTSLDIE